MATPTAPSKAFLDYAGAQAQQRIVKMAIEDVRKVPFGQGDADYRARVLTTLGQLLTLTEQAESGAARKLADETMAGVR
jgi:hypothetical protein